MDSENVILKKIKQQLETVRGEFDAARLDLDSLVNAFIDDISGNLKNYVLENIRREIRKSPGAAEAMSDAQFDGLRRALADALETDVARIAGELRGSPAWLEEDTAFLDLNSKVWKSVKSVEPSANAVLKKFGLNPVNMKNWAWLSPGIDALITTRFPAAKKEFTDKQKQLKYLENRYTEETRLGDILNKLESL